MSAVAASGIVELKIAQMVLESAHFGHTGDFLAEPIDAPVPSTPADVNVEVLSNEADKAAVRLRVSSSDPSAPYAYDVAYWVLFRVTGGPRPEDFEKRLLVTGATMLMPFVREVVASLSGKGRFGPTWLSPVDFNSMAVQVAGTPGKPAGKPRRKKVPTTE